MSELSDSELMVQVREGDPSGLGTLFQRHHRRLYNFCLRMTRRGEASQDLVQEVFLRMLRYRDSFRSDGPFLPWMYRVARNVCADHLQGLGRDGNPGLEAPEPSTPDPSASEVVDYRQRLRRLADALEHLPPDARELVLMARFGALSYRQIGAVLGCSEGAVKVRVHRAMRRLRAIYDRLEEEATP